jgi:hypothetical protein
MSSIIIGSSGSFFVQSINSKGSSGISSFSCCLIFSIFLNFSGSKLPKTAWASFFVFSNSSGVIFLFSYSLFFSCFSLANSGFSSSANGL